MQPATYGVSKIAIFAVGDDPDKQPQLSFFNDGAELGRRTQPILRWAGGKQKLVPRIKTHAPREFRRYHEPFFGGGALFFALAPQSATISDVNWELITFYTVLRDDFSRLISCLENYAFSEDFYYAVRDQKPQQLGAPEIAARFYFLNRFCWNGLYRVNRSGRFNVPIGKFKNTPLVFDPQTLASASRALQGVEIVRRDFRKASLSVLPGDFVYFDPPYHSEGRNFKEYDEDGFDFADQEALAAIAETLVEGGVRVIVSNNAMPSIAALYEKSSLFAIHEFAVNREINSVAASRVGSAREMLVVSK